jgi:hypothetical protein
MEIIDQIKTLIGHEKAGAYKAGFQDGVRFVTEPSESLIHAVEKAKDNVLSQVDNIYGQGKEYNVALQCLNAVIIDLKQAAHIIEPKTMQDFWNDEYGDDL